MNDEGFDATPVASGCDDAGDNNRHLSLGPRQMVVVDDKAVGMPHGPVAMRMPVRFGSLPALMIMLMVLVVDMQMLMIARAVLMYDFHRVRPRPQRHRKSRGDEDHGG